ncbi:MAG: prolyl oligopeptidase family serine peptidase [Flavobacteriaceae bacterium]|nr:prolyl oligopeptidase family serine peptidase [Flavobacteriaceae bacterium]
MKKSILTTLTIFIFANAFAQQKWNYPPTPKIPVYDTIWGKVIQDDYRWMEDMKDPKVVDWFKAQAEFTNVEMAKIPGQDQLVKEMKSLDAMQSASVRGIGKAGGKYFYRMRKNGEQTDKLYYKQGQNGKEVLLFDPEKFEEGKTFNFQASLNDDGSVIALLLTERGAETGEVRFLETKSHKLLPEVLINVASGEFAGGSTAEFLYRDMGTSDLRDPQSRMNRPYKLHILGTPISSDIILASTENNPELGIQPKDAPMVKVFKNAHFITLQTSPWDTYKTVFYAPKSELRNKKSNWKKLAVPGDEIKAFLLQGNDVFMLTSKGNAKNKLIKTSLLKFDLENAQVIAEGNEDWLVALDAMIGVKDYLAYTKTKNEIESKVFLYHFKTGKTEEIKTSLSGNIYSFSFSGENKDDNEIILTNSGWNVPLNYYVYHPKSKKLFTDIFTQKHNYPGLENIVYEEVEVRSHDGVMVPLSIVYDRTLLKKDGSNIVYMVGYGAYGYPSSPVFFKNFLLLYNRGVILATAHVRGGGEKGNEWHLGGKKTTKPNSWKDFNACAEYLIRNNYTSSEKFGIMGPSAGGILIGRAITERPDLYRVAIPKVGSMNALRFEFSPNGPANIHEFGTIAIEEEFEALLQMDAFHHIQKGIKYPAQLVTTGFNDPRVESYFPGKFAAKMQANNGSDYPVFLDVNYGAGHGGSIDADAQYKQVAKEFAFLFWQTGHPDFQPKK